MRAEDQNVIKIYSTVKYGYNHTLPVLVAQNAEDETVLFESYEESFRRDNIDYLPGLIPTPIPPPTTLSSPTEPKHTGSRSLKTKANVQVPLGVIKVNTQIRNEGLLVRLWLHAKDDRSILSDRVILGFHNMTVRTPMKKIAAAGVWSLFESIVRPDQISGLIDMSSVAIVVASREGQDIFGDIFIDDVRIQPLQSPATGANWPS